MEMNSIILHFQPTPLAVITDSIVKESARFSASPTQEAYKARALWDTGAQMCAISAGLARDMNLRVQGYVRLGGFGSDEDETPFYRIDITLIDGQHFSNVAAAEYADKDSHDIIIGLNLITLGDFALTREEGGTRFSFTMD
jgi:hypothetical protein